LSSYEPGRWHAADISKRVFDWVTEDTKSPLFAAINFADVHAPVFAPEPFQTLLKEARMGKSSAVGEGSVRASFPQSILDARREVNDYDAGIMYVDKTIMDLLDNLNSSGFSDIMVIITADHGEERGEHGIFGHGMSLYFPSLHVPLASAFVARTCPSWPACRFRGEQCIHCSNDRRIVGSERPSDISGTIAGQLLVCGARRWNAIHCGS
jgi:arylsulfatase A-like enzyme